MHSEHGFDMEQQSTSCDNLVCCVLSLSLSLSHNTSSVTINYKCVELGDWFAPVPLVWHNHYGHILVLLIFTFGHTIELNERWWWWWQRRRRLLLFWWTVSLKWQKSLFFRWYFVTQYCFHQHTISLQRWPNEKMGNKKKMLWKEPHTDTTCATRNGHLEHTYSNNNNVMYK